MSAEFDKFTQALSATKTSEEIERDKQKQLEAKKEKMIAASRRKIEDSGVRSLFNEIIENKIVKDGFIKEGVTCVDSYFICLIFNKKPDGSYDFCSIAAHPDFSYSDPFPLFCSTIYAYDFSALDFENNFGGSSTHKNHDEVNRKFNKNQPFDVEGYVAEKITNPDQFIRYSGCCNMEP